MTLDEALEAVDLTEADMAARGESLKAHPMYSIWEEATATAFRGVRARLRKADADFLTLGGRVDALPIDRHRYLHDAEYHAAVETVRLMT